MTVTVKQTKIKKKNENSLNSLTFHTIPRQFHIKHRAEIYLGIRPITPTAY